MKHQEFVQFMKDQGGIYLEERLGVSEWAFKREDALKMLESMKKRNIPCTGGDAIFEDEQGRLSYDNGFWHYNRSEKDITQEEYIGASIKRAQEYIKNYPEKDNKKYYYVLV